jgi:hypothetical protein
MAAVSSPQDAVRRPASPLMVVSFASIFSHGHEIDLYHGAFFDVATS